MPTKIFQRPYTTALSFNGVDSALVKANPVGINTGTGATTFVGWVYLRKNTIQCISEFSAAFGAGSSSRSHVLGISSGVAYLFFDRLNASNNVTTTTDNFEAFIGLNKHRRVMWSVSSTAIDVYVDGVLLVHQVFAIPLNTSAYLELLVGKAHTSIYFQFLDGIVKDFDIYNRTFTADEALAEYYDAMKPATPVSNFLMEAGSGTSIADSIGSNTMTAINVTWTSFIPMAARKVLTLTDRVMIRNVPSCIEVATNAGILVPFSASLNPTNVVAVEIDAKPTSGKVLVLFDNSLSGVTLSYFLLVGGDGSLGWYSTIGGVAKNIPTTTLKLLMNQWNKIIAWYDGSNITLTANGVVMGTLAATGALGANTGQLRIGQYYSAGLPSDGWITKPRIYNRVFTLQDAKDRFFDNRDDAAMRTGLVLDMPTDEAGGAVVRDVSPQGNHGAFSRAVWSSFTQFNDRIKIRTQGTGAIRLNGINQWVDLGNTGPICNSVSAFSASCWFKRDKIAGTAGSQLVAMIGDNNNAAQNHWNFQTQGPGRKLLTSVISSTLGLRALVGQNNIPLGMWEHAVLTYDGAFVRWYFNGLQDSFTTCTGAVTASTAGMLIGNGSAPIGGVYRLFGGLIQDVKYWDRAITAQEVYDMYFLARNDAALRTSLKGEWLLYSDALDTSGFGNHGTLIGSPVFDTVDLPFRDRFLTV